MRNTPMRRQFLFGLGGAAAVAAAMRSVTEHGAVGDGTRLNTQSIQQAVDACAQAGGGTVYFPAGRYRSGTIVLRSQVSLHLDSGAVLLGSENLADYPPHIPAMRSFTDTYTDKSLIYAEKVENAAIGGRGLIDGQGARFKGPYKVRPYMMRFIECRNVSVTGVSIQDSPMWVQHYLGCDEVHIDGIRVYSRVNANNDGIDIDCCRKVRIANCDIWSGDDAIVLKSTAARPCQDVVIANCVLSSRCNALKMGTESNGGFENIAIGNCSIYDTRLAGVALEIVDGGVMDRVAVSNITMNNVTVPIFIRLGNRARPFQEGGPVPAMGGMRNITISNIEAVGAKRVGCAIAGLPGHRIENLAIDNVRLRFEGGGKRAEAQREIPENAEKYPEHNMFGTLPAYGFYCRHVQNLALRNIQTDFEQDEERPALVCDDVEGLEISGSALRGPAAAEPTVRLRAVRDAFLHGCRAPRPVELFLAAAACEGVALAANELSKARRRTDPAELERS